MDFDDLLIVVWDNPSVIDVAIATHPALPQKVNLAVKLYDHSDPETVAQQLIDACREVLPKSMELSIAILSRRSKSE